MASGFMNIREVFISIFKKIWQIPLSSRVEIEVSLNKQKQKWVLNFIWNIHQEWIARNIIVYIKLSRQYFMERTISSVISALR